jgi:hypothetical protein
MLGQLAADSPNELLCTADDEPRVLNSHIGPRLALKPILGEAFVASAAWQCVAACAGVREKEYPAANIVVSGTNQQAIGARFVSHEG